jgi:putative membrane protein
MSGEPANPKSILSDVSTDLSSRRTGMSVQRTRMSADRTLMSVIRTSLSLIGFGFTINQFFHKLREDPKFAETLPARHFGISLVVLGVVMLTLGILYHLQYMYKLRTMRRNMIAAGLLHGDTPIPVSLTLIIAFLLLMLGISSFLSMVYHVGPLD